VALVLNALLPHEDEELDLESEELKDLTTSTHAGKDVEEQDEDSEDIKEIAK
jgi:hypothetical protein